MESKKTLFLFFNPDGELSVKISIFLMMDLIIPPKFSTENHNSAGYWSQSAGKEDFLEPADDVRMDEFLLPVESFHRGSRSCPAILRVGTRSPEWLGNLHP